MGEGVILLLGVEGGEREAWFSPVRWASSAIVDSFTNRTLRVERLIATLSPTILENSGSFIFSL